MHALLMFDGKKLTSITKGLLRLDPIWTRNADCGSTEEYCKLDELSINNRMKHKAVKYYSDERGTQEYVTNPVGNKTENDVVIKENIEPITGMYQDREKDIEEENIRRFWLDRVERSEEVVPTKEESDELAGTKDETVADKEITGSTAEVTEEFPRSGYSFEFGKIGERSRFIGRPVVRKTGTGWIRNPDYRPTQEYGEVYKSHTNNGMEHQAKERHSFKQDMQDYTIKSVLEETVDDVSSEENMEPTLGEKETTKLKWTGMCWTRNPEYRPTKEYGEVYKSTTINGIEHRAKERHGVKLDRQDYVIDSALGKTVDDVSIEETREPTLRKEKTTKFKWTEEGCTSNTDYRSTKEYDGFYESLIKEGEEHRVVKHFSAELGIQEDTTDQKELAGYLQNYVAQQLGKLNGKELVPIIKEDLELSEDEEDKDEYYMMEDILNQEVEKVVVSRGFVSSSCLRRYECLELLKDEKERRDKEGGAGLCKAMKDVFDKRMEKVVVSRRLFSTRR